MESLFVMVTFQLTVNSSADDLTLICRVDICRVDDSSPNMFA